jgi:glycosyltransferase involved in cell wall biosynthesis
LARGTRFHPTHFPLTSLASRLEQSKARQATAESPRSECTQRDDDESESFATHPLAALMAPPRIVMAGTDVSTMGGISSVVDVYRGTSLFKDHDIEYLVTHRDGGYVTKFVTAFKALLRLISLLLLGRIGLLHVHLCSRNSCWRKMFFIWPAYVARVPVIVHLHGGAFAEFYDHECGPLRRRLIRATFDRATRVIVLSESWRQWVQGMSARAHIVTLPNPVVSASGGHEQFDRTGRDILFLGRLVEGKGVNDLLAAVARMSSAVAPPHLWLCGEGDIATYRTAAKKLGIEQLVHFPGWVRGEHKASLLGRASMFALPSYQEGLPMSILEAMAAGLPVVSTRVGGIPEAVTDGVEGFLIEPGDVDALADRLGRLLSDPATVKRMGHAARARVEATFAAEHIVARLGMIYAELGFH